MFKKFLTLIVIVGVAALFVGCPPSEEVIEPPSNLTISADNTGTMVELRWDASPTEDIDGYIVYFKPINGDFNPVDTVNVTNYTHNPNGLAGEYQVTAYKDDNESDPTETVSSVPVANDVVTVYELNGAGSAGYGWDRTSGAGATYPMAQAASAASVDFYITNFTAGVDVLPYYIASPDVARQSAYDATIVPDAPWRVNGIKQVDGITANSVLPQAGEYLNFEQLIGNVYFGVHTEDNYYGLIYTEGTPNTTEGTQDIRTWFQLVQGLRIINHE